MDNTIRRQTNSSAGRGAQTPVNENAQSGVNRLIAAVRSVAVFDHLPSGRASRYPSDAAARRGPLPYMPAAGASSSGGYASRHSDSQALGSWNDVEIFKRTIGTPGNESWQDFSINFKKYHFTDDQKIEIAKEYVKSIPAECLADFSFADKNKRYEFLEMVFKGNSYKAGRMCRAMKITDQEELIKIGEEVVDAGLGSIVGFLSGISVQINDEKKRCEWARKLAKNDPYTAVSHLGSFGLSKPNNLEMMLLAAENLSFESGAALDDNELLSRDEKSVFLLAVAGRAPSVVGASLANGYKYIGEEGRLTIAKKVGESSPLVLFEDIKLFQIKKQDQLRNLFFDNYAGLIDAVIEGAIRSDFYNDYPDTSDRLKALFTHVFDAAEKFFPEPNEAIPFRENAQRMGCSLPCIADFLAASSQMPDENIRKKLLTWSHGVRVMFNTLNPHVSHDAVASTLQAIFSFRNPDIRHGLVHVLGSQVGIFSDDRTAAEKFDKVSSLLPSHHARPFRPLLCALMPDLQASDEFLSKYKVLLSSRFLKDASRRNNVTSGLLHLVQAPNMTLSEKQHLLEFLTPKGCGDREVKEFASAMQVLADFLPLARDESLQTDAQAVLAEIKNVADLEAGFEKLFQKILGRSHRATGDSAGANCFAQNVREISQNFRRPNALIQYAAKLYSELDEGEEKALVFETLNRCVDAVFLPDSPSGHKRQKTEPENTSTLIDRSAQSFIRLRNDVSRSPHLQKAYDIDRKGAEYFLNHQMEMGKVFQNYAQKNVEFDIKEYLRARIVEYRHVRGGTFPLIEKLLARDRDAQESEMPLDSTSRLNAHEKSLSVLLNPAQPAKLKIQAVDDLLESLLEVEGCQEFIHDLEGLRSILAEKGFPRQDVNDWKLKFCLNFEDYLLCGTEVIGSCQRIDGTQINKSLMGYVTQGKNRIITINSQSGAIEARAVIRLGIDEENNQLVLHLERSYVNPGVPGIYKEVFADFARRLAEEMGKVPVVTNTDEYGPSSLSSRTVRFLPDAAAFEYVDSEGLHTQYGKEGYVLRETRIL